MVTVCILFVITTTFMIICFGDNEKENKVPKSVHFYVTCYNDNPPSGLELWIGKPKWHRPPGDIFYKWIGYGPVMRLTNASNFGDYNLNVNDFSHMKKGDIEEVNINFKNEKFDEYDTLCEQYDFPIFTPEEQTQRNIEFYFLIKTYKIIK